MSLSYCSLHKRLFSRRYYRWVTFSQKTIDELRGYYELLRSTHVDASHLEVVEMSCDQCAVIFREVDQINGNRFSA
jgi:hypothetical protein